MFESMLFQTSLELSKIDILVKMVKIQNRSKNEKHWETLISNLLYQTAVQAKTWKSLYFQKFEFSFRTIFWQLEFTKLKKKDSYTDACDFVILTYSKRVHDEQFN